MVGGFDYPAGATPLDPDEAEGLLIGVSTQAELNELEEANIEEALRWLKTSRQVKTSLLTTKTLTLIHGRMFRGVWRWAGKFRQTQKSVGCEAWRVATELQMLCDDVQVWIEHQTYPPAEILARFHHRLTWIHPFPNGNGRWARAAADALARNLGFRTLNWGRGLQLPREEYLAALREADGHQYERLIAFMVFDPPLQQTPSNRQS